MGSATPLDREVTDRAFDLYLLAASCVSNFGDGTSEVAKAFLVKAASNIQRRSLRHVPDYE